MASKLLLAIPIGFILDSCSNYSASKEKSSPELIKVVFDVPALLGKNIDEIRKILGQPIGKDIEPTKQQVQTERDFGYWDNEFLKDNLSLIVSFDPKTRKVKDYIISSDTPIEDISVWEKQGNLTETDKRYSIKAIDLDRKHLKFTGIIITPSK